VPSRLGSRAPRILGNGTKAIFELEMDSWLTTAPTASGPAALRQRPPFARRHSWVGLTGGWVPWWGGRVDGARYGVVGRYDPFEQGGVANAASLQVPRPVPTTRSPTSRRNYEGLYACSPIPAP